VNPTVARRSAVYLRAEFGFLVDTTSHSCVFSYECPSNIRSLRTLGLTANVRMVCILVKLLLDVSIHISYYMFHIAHYSFAMRTQQWRRHDIARVATILEVPFHHYR
jgi:hypothetical protein